MALAAAFARQLARPNGTTGRLLGHAMDFANRKPTRMAIDLLDPRDGDVILDVGCGTGAALEAVLRRAPVQAVGIDPSEVMAQMAAQRLGNRATIRCTSVETMPVAPGIFSAALLLNTLYFCDRDGAMLARVHGALQPGGRVVAYVTHRDTMRHWAFTRAGVHRLYDEAELAALFETAGFAPSRIWVQSRPITRSVTGLFALAIR